MTTPDYFAADTYDQPEIQTIQTRQPDSPVSPRLSGIGESGESGKSGKPPRLYRADELKEGTPTRWLARGTIPQAEVSVLIGAEGIGKSLWWVLVVSYVTTGRKSNLLGIPQREPRDVVLILTEDSWADVRARLVSAGADLARIRVFCEDDDGTGAPTFPDDFVYIVDELKHSRPGLIVVDAWLDTVRAGIQIKDTQQAREALHPWKEFAARSGAGVLLLGHTNRTDSDDLRSMIGATAALRQKARVLLFAMAPPETEGVLYVGSEKSNHAGRSTATEYRIDVQQVREETDDDPGTVPRLRVVGDTGRTVQDHFATWRKQSKEAARPQTADEKAAEWVRDYLTDRGGQALASEVQEAATFTDVNPKRLPAAVKSLGGYVGPGDGPRTPHVYRLTLQTLQTLQLASDGEPAGESEMSDSEVAA